MTAILCTQCEVFSFTNYETLVVTKMLFSGNQGLDIRGEHKLLLHITIAIQSFGKAKNNISASTKPVRANKNLLDIYATSGDDSWSSSI